MTPRGYDKYFVKLGMGTHPKLARLTDSERCAHVFGVLALAAASPRRGCLLVGDLPAEAVDVAAAAGVSRAVATTALVKLQAVGVLYFDGDIGCLVVHDWEDVNPPPRTDQTNAERQAAYRARNAGSNATRNGNVTARVTTTEVEVEVEGSATQRNNNAELRSAVIEIFAYWQDRCGHQQAALSPDRRGKIESRLRERAKLGGGMHQAIADVRLAIDGAALAAFVDERGKRHDDIELICRKGSKLEDFMGRASLPAAGAQVLPINRKSTVSELHRKLMANEGEAS